MMFVENYIKVYWYSASWLFLSFWQSYGTIEWMYVYVCMCVHVWRL